MASIALRQHVFNVGHSPFAHRWQAARDAHDQINSRKLTYNPLGGDLNGPRD